MKKRGVVVFIMLIILAGLAVLSFFYGRQIFADIVATNPYTVFQKPVFDYVYSDTKPNSDEIISKTDALSIFAAKGEIEPITFSVRANQDLGKADVKVSDLIYGNSKITSDNIEIYNIKTWDQCQYDPAQPSSQKDCRYEGKHLVEQVPELLVKDSEQDLIAEEVGWVTSEKKYYAPEVNDTFNVSLDKGSTHTFYLRIKTPIDADAGKYSGKILFSPQLADKREINIELEIMPFSLPQDEKDRLIYFNQRTIGGGELQLSREQYENYIDVIREAGMNGVVVYQSNYDEIIWTIDLLAEKGFDGTVVFTSYIGSVLNTGKVAALSNYVKKKGLDPYFYGKDEPADIDTISEHLKLVERVHDQGGKVMSAIRKQCLDATDDPDFYLYGQNDNPETLQITDLPNYAFVTNMDKDGSPDQLDCVGEVRQGYRSDLRYSFLQYINGLWDGTVDKKRDKEYFYNQIQQQREPRNRILYGFGLWRSGLDGTSPYGFLGHYTTITRNGEVIDNHGSKYYDDFDGPKREYNSIYPSTDEPVLTLQWEGYREGIDDSRYTTLLRQEIDAIKSSDPGRASQLEQSLRSILSQYTAYPYQVTPTGNTNIWYKKISDKTNQENRRQIANMIREIGANTNAVTLDKGYNGFVPPALAVIASGLINKGVVPVQFNRNGDGNWQILSSKNSISFEPYIGYYLYNKRDTQNLPLSPAVATAEMKNPTINKGWNLLSNPSDYPVKLSALKYTYNGKSLSLDNLIESKAAYSTLYIVKNQTATTAEEAFQEVKIDLAKLPAYTIPPQKMFWFYVW